MLRYNVSFSGLKGIRFDLAAHSDKDPFDLYSDDNASEWGDYLRVSSLIGGVRTLLAEFTGVATTERTAETAFALFSTDAGSGLGKGIIADKTFDTVHIAGLGPEHKGYGELLFEIKSTGSAEQIGIDNIRLVPVPLPSSFYLTMFSVIMFWRMGNTGRLVSTMGRS